MIRVRGRRREFVTPSYARGFTPTLGWSLPEGHLTPFPVETHGGITLPLVRPFEAGDPQLLLWPRLTPRSAHRDASPFQEQGEASPSKFTHRHRTTAGFTPPSLGRESFAVTCRLALNDSASNPIPVRRLTGSFHASFSTCHLTVGALRFPSVPAARSREDSHLQAREHVGHTRERPRIGVRRSGVVDGRNSVVRGVPACSPVVDARR